MDSLKQTTLLAKPKLHSTNDPSGIGHLDTLDPSVPVLIRIGPYIGMMDSDYIELFWGDQEGSIANYTVKPGDTAEGTGSFVTLPVDQRYIVPPADINPHYRVDTWYTVKRLVGGTFNKSERLPITVKLTVPGGIDNTPDTPYINENLSLCTITPEGTIGNGDLDQVTVNIAAYQNMEINDAITVFWHGTPVRHSLDELPAADQLISVSIPRETIIGAGDSDTLVGMYEVRDTVNNWSRFSLPTYVEVEAGNSTLPAPVAPQAANMELDLASLAGADVQALVLSYPGINATDEITFTVERNTAEGLGLDPYVAMKPVGTSIGFVQFLIPNEQFEPIAQGRARLKYKVRKVSGEEQRSKSLPLTIVGEAQVLAPPKLPAAEENNGVLDPTAHNVIAQVPAYYFMADGNDVTLVWMGKTASGANVIHEEVKNLNSDDVGQTVAFLIPDDKVSALAGGTLELYYTVTTFARAFFKSPSLQVQVGTDGGALLPSPSVDGASADGVLDPADIVLEAVVRVRPYAGMAPLDKVTLHWDGSTPDASYSTSTTLNSGMLGKDVIFRVKKHYVDANLDGSVAVRYEVVRGNRTLASETLLLKIGATVITPLPDPTVKEAKEDGTLDPVDTFNGATVVIDASANLKEGDFVTVSWQSPGGRYAKDKAISASQAGQELLVIFSGTIVANDLGNKVQIYYVVTRVDGTIEQSNVLDLLIDTALSHLPKPAVAGVDVNNIMNLENVPGYGVLITVPRYTGIDEKDSIVVKWDGPQNHVTPAKEAGTAANIEFVVPKSVVIGSADGAVQVTYEVTRNNALPLVSPATAFKVVAGAKPPLIIDTSELVLIARHLRAAATPKFPPAGAFAQRVASGGVAPYRYESSAPTIAEVDATGRVISVSNGAAAIIVTDSAGQRVSYNVKTSNVLTFVYFIFHTYTEAMKPVNSAGAHMPSLADWNTLRANYGGDPGLSYEAGRDSRAWAADVAGLGKRWAIFPRDGRTLALKDVGFGGEAAHAFGMKG
ncbi:hypothetical protein QN399_02565 [Pseudomonas sp. 10C3]|uniref:hypothetical protein n=1 Tax=Pseudomonas sp. 10C3 TaxID=3118753 RepID=UPI002E80A105|nr:hypothetical protein [Pseudomonas sp. 10C3]MEE3505155.1 hypothetical protein [Pseudomonas sp. 10C3]